MTRVSSIMKNTSFFPGVAVSLDRILAFVLFICLFILEERLRITRRDSNFSLDRIMKKRVFARFNFNLI